MDDFNRRMAEARRQAAREHSLRVEREVQKEAEEDAARITAPTGRGRLVLKRVQGEFRYYLAEERVRNGEQIEFFVSPAAGWLRGTFEWGRRNTSAPTLLVRLVHPEDPNLFLGDMAVTLPDEAQCRWPDPG